MNHNSYINSLNHKDTRELNIIWDLGPRCNFDCVYCDPITHDNHSEHATFDELKQTTFFIKEYLDLVLSYRKKKNYNVSLTGGEPTYNPHFDKIIPYLHEKFGKHFNITTNGSFNNDVRNVMKDHMTKLTISYHCDSSKAIKERVVDNMLWLKENGFKFRVNLMFHFREDYFRECIQLAKFFETKNINYVPRVVNHHPYTDEQSKWFADYWASKSSQIKTKKEEPKKVHTHSKQQANKVKKNPIKEKDHTTVIKGRHCCSAGQDLEVESDNKWLTERYVKDTNFNEWYCSINWFFTHINQKTGDVYYHQTCQHNFGNKREPIGNLKDTNLIIEDLKNKFDSGQTPIIKCTIDWCKCGMCTPKSYNLNTFKDIMKNHTTVTYGME